VLKGDTTESKTPKSMRCSYDANIKLTN